MKFSKLYVVLALSAGYILNVDAQVVVPTPGMRDAAAEKAGKPVPRKNWEHLSFEKDSVYGIALDRAYHAFPKNKAKKKLVVAIIDSGVDTAHADLKNMLWTNEKEIKGNGKDDDNNGYIDDVHGWNFLGTADGKHNVVKTNLEADREYLRLRDRYINVSFDDYRKNPKYAYFRSVVTKSALGSKEFAVIVVKRLAEENKKLVAEIQQKNPGKVLHMVDYAGYKPTDSMFMYAQAAVMMAVMYKKVPDTTVLGPFMQKFSDDMIASNQQEYLTAKQSVTDNRDLMGDDFTKNVNRYYGNNTLLLPNAKHGTHVAGIVAAERNNGLGLDGIADNVSIMAIRAVPDGDEYDKDIANAIYYAVDNGAKIINMSFGKPFSPQKQWVDEAFRYAEKKGVLIVKAAGNDAKDLDVDKTFPDAVFLDGKKAGNVITVGASTAEGKAAQFSNYGKNTVDLFAPGVDIYSAVPNNEYLFLPGTSMASPVVTGTAALVWSRFPKLTYLQLKEILLKSVTRVSGVTLLPGAQDPIEVPFATLSATGGIVNAYEALKLANTYGK
ncbi:cell wall-associated protease [Pedobacter africanus]|uniref:Subtilisin family serine protease n=1 Tax=Pedobacter africanus TaxID=151894 RepID=A0ACC6KUD8_9SPHI|nr:S8 family peptidase [Pedobacter africanus]MDR6782760.1 subtilisin family serine protease [Pedobacter africanus]